ncbi:MAG: lysophospholipid acyltransferase family protein [Bdellovibrionota bacterium]
MVSLFSYCAFVVILSFSYFLQALGLRVLGWLGAGLGALLYTLHFRRRIVTDNLKLALGSELSELERERLCRKVYRSVGLTFLEIARNFSLSREKMIKELILSDADAAMVRSVASRNMSGVFISGHFGNWELLAMGMAAKGFPVAIVVKRMNNPLAQLLIERQRLRTGIQIIYAGGTIERMKEALKHGATIGFMVDQNTTGKKGIRANFFGVPASSIRGLAGLVRETGTAIVPFCAVRQPDGRNRIKFLPELPYLTAPELSENSPERMAREEWLNTQQYQSAIEKMVRENPAQWLWIHRRWKADRRPLVPELAHRENMN